MVSPQYPPGHGGTAPMSRIPADPVRGRPRLLKVLGLVAVAVVAGLVWWLIRHEPGPPAAAQAPPREFAFTKAEGPVAATDCTAKSTGEVKKWLGAHPCLGMSRALFTTTTASGSDTLVSVAVVTLPTNADAKTLATLTDRDGTGNVTDLVADGTAKISGAPKLSDGVYASRLNGNRLVIVLSAFFDGHSDDVTLARVDAEALDLAPQLG